MRSRDAASGAVLAAFAALALLEARRLSVGTLRTPGPGFFPTVLTTALLIISIAIVIVALRSPARETRAPRPSLAGRARAVITLAALVAYVFLMEPLGFTIATAMLLALLFTVVAPGRWLLALGGSVVAAGAAWLVFRVWLQVPLPAGPWGF
jgi:putative tricarboxylic transport membrane protein